jgi:hypothetical protein
MTERKPAIPSRSLLDGMKYVRAIDTDVGRHLRKWNQEQARAALEPEVPVNVARINARSPK